MPSEDVSKYLGQIHDYPNVDRFGQQHLLMYRLGKRAFFTGPHIWNGLPPDFCKNCSF